METEPTNTTPDLPSDTKAADDIKADTPADGDANTTPDLSLDKESTDDVEDKVAPLKFSAVKGVNEANNSTESIVVSVEDEMHTVLSIEDCADSFFVRVSLVKEIGDDVYRFFDEGVVEEINKRLKKFKKIKAVVDLETRQLTVDGVVVQSFYAAK